MRKLFSLALVTLIGFSAFAGGYRISVQGQKQLAMGHTGVAVINSAEIAFFNPGGTVFLDKKLNVSVGASVLFANINFKNEQYNWDSSSKNTGTPFNVYATYKLNDFLTAGLAVYTPYGSSVEWDQDWEGAHLVNNISLSAIFVQPSLAIRAGEHFGFGAGLIYASGSVKFNRNLSTNPILSNNGEATDVTLDQSGISGWGYNLGIMFNPTDKVHLGLNYRSEIIMEARGGDATYADVPTFNPLSSTTFDADLPLPAEFTAGLSVEITDKWLVAFDYNYALWNVYEALHVDFGNGTSSHNPRNYKNASTYRLGTQYKMNDKFTFRAGYYYDESPVQDGYFAPETPRNDSNAFTGGLTYQVNNKLGVDFSFLYIHFDEIENSYDYSTDPVSGTQNPSFKGTYKSVVFSPGIGITYGF